MIREISKDVKVINVNKNDNGKIVDFNVKGKKILTTCFKFNVSEILSIPSILMIGILNRTIKDKFSDITNSHFEDYVSEKECFKKDFFEVEIIECIGNYGYGTEVSYNCKIISAGGYLTFINGQTVNVIVPESYLLNKSEVNGYIEMNKKCYVSEGYNSILKSRYGTESPSNEESKSLKIISKTSSWTDFTMEEIEVPSEIEGVFSDGSVVNGDIDAIVTIKGNDFVKVMMRASYKDKDKHNIEKQYEFNY